MLRRWAKSLIAPFQNVGAGRVGEEERPKRKRRARANPLEVELDLSGGFPPGEYVGSSLEGEKEAHVVSVNDFRQKLGLKCTSNYQAMMISNVTIWGRCDLKSN